MDHDIVCFTEPLRNHIPDFNIPHDISIGDLKIEFYYPYTFQWFLSHGLKNKDASVYLPIPVRVLYQFEKYSLHIIAKYQNHINFKSDQQLSELEHTMMHYFSEFKEDLTNRASAEWSKENSEYNSMDNISLRFRKNAFNTLFIYNKPIEKVKILGTCCGCKYWGLNGFVLTIDDCSISPHDRLRRDDIPCFVSSTCLIRSGISVQRETVIGKKFLVYGYVSFTDFEQEIIVNAESIVLVTSLKEEFDHYTNMEIRLGSLMDERPWFLPRIIDENTQKSNMKGYSLTQYMESKPLIEQKKKEKRLIYNKGTVVMDEWLQTEFEMDFVKKESQDEVESTDNSMEERETFQYLVPSSYYNTTNEALKKLSKKEKEEREFSVKKVELEEKSSNHHQGRNHTVSQEKDDMPDLEKIVNDYLFEDGDDYMDFGFKEQVFQKKSSKNTSSKEHSEKPMPQFKTFTKQKPTQKIDIQTDQHVDKMIEKPLDGRILKPTKKLLPPVVVHLAKRPSKELNKQYLPEHIPEFKTQFQPVKEIVDQQIHSTNQVTDISLLYYNLFCIQFICKCVEQSSSYIPSVKFQYQNPKLLSLLNEISTTITKEDLERNMQTGNERMFKLKFENVKQHLVTDTIKQFKTENPAVCLMYNKSNFIDTSNMKVLYLWLKRKIHKLIALKMTNYTFRLHRAALQSIPDFKDTIVNQADPNGSSVSSEFLKICLEYIMKNDFDNKKWLINKWECTRSNQKGEASITFTY